MLCQSFERQRRTTPAPPICTLQVTANGILDKHIITCEPSATLLLMVPGQLTVPVVSLMFTECARSRHFRSNPRGTSFPALHAPSYFSVITIVVSSRTIQLGIKLSEFATGVDEITAGEWKDACAGYSQVEFEDFVQGKSHCQAARPQLNEPPGQTIPPGQHPPPEWDLSAKRRWHNRGHHWLHQCRARIDAVYQLQEHRRHQR